MLGDVPPTQYDLRFSLWGIPVRVHPLFWVLAAFVTWVQGRLDLSLVGIACVFLSILVHEMGHALTARSFGWPPNILLYHFGGLAFYTPHVGHTPQRAILISFAGPGAGFLLYGLVRGIEFSIFQFGDPHTLSEASIRAIILLQWINLYWGLFNLIPLFPLDGGQISRSLFTWLLPSQGLSVSLKLSMLSGAAAAIFFLVNHHTFAALMFAGLTVNCYQQYQAYFGHRR